MPEDTQVAHIAAPQPNAEVELSFGDRVSKLGAEDRLKYKLTGELPALADKQAASETPEKAVETAPAPEAGKIPEPKAEPKPERTDGNRRLQRALKERAEWKAKAELLEQQLAGKPAPAAPRSNATVSSDGRPIRPKISDFDDTEAYDAAMDAYDDAKDAYRDRQRQQVQAKVSEDAEFEEFKGSFHSRCAEFRKTNPGFDKAFDAVKVALSDDQGRPIGPHIDAYLLESDKGPALVQYLSAHTDVLGELLDLSPRRATARLGVIEENLKKAPIPNKLTRATDVPAKVGGSNEPALGPAIGTPAWQKAEREAQIRRLNGE